MHRLGPTHLGAQPPLCEVARSVETWRREPNAALADFARIDDALSVFADGQYAEATRAHQFCFADFVAGDGVSTLVIAPPPGDAPRAAPLMRSLLAQLVTECASAPDMDHLGRRKKHELLIVIEAEACRELGAPLIAGFAANGCHALVQARNVNEGAALFSRGTEAVAAIAAIGPQDEASAKFLSEHGGEYAFWRRFSTYRPVWMDVLLPTWVRQTRPIVSGADLCGASSNMAHSSSETCGRSRRTH